MKALMKTLDIDYFEVVLGATLALALVAMIVEMYVEMFI